jgi:predicted DNA-binding transcriptional regulator AlpA
MTTSKVSELLTRKEVLAKTKLSRTALFKLEQVGDFPRHFMITPRCAAWFEDEVDAWLLDRKNASLPAAGFVEAPGRAQLDSDDSEEVL